MTNALAIVTLDIDSATTIDTTQLCDEALAMIRDYEHRVRETSITLGLKLLEVKDSLPHGQFTPWVETVAHWDIRTAQRLMSIARELGDKHDTLTHVPRNMVYQIAKLPADKRDNVLTLITDPTHPPLTEIKTRVKEITEAEEAARKARKEARDQAKTGSPSDLALKKRANYKAKELTEREASGTQKKNFAGTMTMILNFMPDYQRAAILKGSLNLLDHHIGEAFVEALRTMNQPATDDQDDSDDGDDSEWNGSSLLDSIMVPTFPQS